MKRKRRIRKYRSLADVRVANVLKRVVQGLSVHCEELQELHKAISKVVMTHEQFAKPMAQMLFGNEKRMI